MFLEPSSRSFPPGHTVSLIFPMFRDIGDLGLGPLPVERSRFPSIYKKIVFLSFIFVYSIWFILFLTNCFRKE